MLKRKILNNYYGGTQQLLVEVSRDIVATISRRSRIKVGLVMCRVRRKMLVSGNRSQ